MIHIFVIGSKGIPAKYGGFETFADKLTAGRISEEIRYHVSRMSNEPGRFEYNGADCFNVRLPMPGAPGRMLHMGLVLAEIEEWMESNNGEKVAVLILGCRVGPLLISHAKKLHELGAAVYCNPDGIEWKRDKWNAAEKKFLRYCEACLVNSSDLVICDSVHIEKYINETYKDKPSTYIAYGADTERSTCSEQRLEEWYALPQVSTRKGGYYLIVGRFVPENNYETMLKEFMKSKTDKDLIIISNVEENKFYKRLLETTGFDKDPRIKFVGTVYDTELLKKIRECAYGYIHGHEIGGTNPSLLEAMASTKLNLLYGCCYNEAVGADTTLYWSKEPGDLAALIERTDALGDDEIVEYGRKSVNRITEHFSWRSICEAYEKIFLSGGREI